MGTFGTSTPSPSATLGDSRRTSGVRVDFGSRRLFSALPESGRSKTARIERSHVSQQQTRCVPVRRLFAALGRLRRRRQVLIRRRTRSLVSRSIALPRGLRPCQARRSPKLPVPNGARRTHLLIASRSPSPSQGRDPGCRWSSSEGVRRLSAIRCRRAASELQAQPSRRRPLTCAAIPWNSYESPAQLERSETHSNRPLSRRRGRPTVWRLLHGYPFATWQSYGEQHQSFLSMTSTLHSTTTSDSDSPCVNTEAADTASQLETASRSTLA